ncbi:MAG: FAD-dependent oxidoreductase [Paracoccaceae bacterium]|jgi:glycine/D-amino acid oxidase-like deaminating enzyme|nr:FAD-dependent oxidoreductase [Paracoccaceae bacterium]
MSRVFEDRAYEAASLNGCFWAHDYPRDDLVWPIAKGELKAEVAIIGAGYTGLSAALRLAQQGVDVAVFDMHEPGWGASGRSGGFCCHGGALASDDSIARRYGDEALAEWDAAQSSSVQLVRALIAQHGIDANTHSDGETQLAHSLRSYRRLRNEAEHANADFISTEDLPEFGMNATGLLGGVTEPEGFALHPRRYVLGLAEAARKAGARIYAKSPVNSIERVAQGYRLGLLSGAATCKKLILATNGYSRDDIPSWLKGRFMPVQSNIIVTRELTDTERKSQGWTTAQMVYDTRRLLHYFRLLPDGRMMFGMRGGISAKPNVDRKMHRMIRKDFDTMFPAWAHIETPWFWTGLVCLTGKRVPFIGEIPEMPNAYTGFGWHGNGIAMGTYAGKQLALMASGQVTNVPLVAKRTPMRIPLGRKRRVLLPPIYKGLAIRDRLR